MSRPRRTSRPGPSPAAASADRTAPAAGDPPGAAHDAATPALTANPAASRAETQTGGPGTAATGTPAAPAAGAAPSLWRDPDFVRYWLSRLVSCLGSAVTYVVVPVLVYRVTGSAAWTSAVVALDTLPYVLLGLVAGAVGDRFDRRRVMVAADVVAACAIGSIVAAHLLGALTLPHLMGAAFAAACATTMFDGANWGALPALVGRERLPSANAKVFGTVSVFDVAGPPAVGALLAVAQPGTLLIADAASFVASALLLRGISRAMSTPREGAREGFGRTVRALGADMVEGVRFLARHPALGPATVMTTFGSAGGAAVAAVMVVWCDRVLGVGTSGWRFGLAYAAWGVGAFLASLLLAAAMARFGALRLSRWTIPVTTLLCLTLSAVTTYAVALPVLLGYVVAHTLQYTAVVTWRQQTIPPELLSRVSSAARMLGWGAAATVGALIAGPVADRLGVRAALVFAGLCHLGGALVAWSPALRRAAEAGRATG